MLLLGQGDLDARVLARNRNVLLVVARVHNLIEQFLVVLISILDRHVHRSDKVTLVRAMVSQVNAALVQERRDAND